MARPPAPGTRERILTVASRLFYEHGVRAVGMNWIITEAGTGKNLLYRHFPTKAALVAAYLERAAEQRLEAGRQALSAAGSEPRDQLVALVAEVADLVQHPAFRGCAFRNYLAEFPDDADPTDAGTDAAGSTGTSAGRVMSPAGVAHAYLTASRTTFAELASRVATGDPERLTEQLFLLVDGLYLQAAYRDRLDDQLAASASAAVTLTRQLVTA